MRRLLIGIATAVTFAMPATATARPAASCGFVKETGTSVVEFSGVGLQASRNYTVSITYPNYPPDDNTQTIELESSRYGVVFFDTIYVGSGDYTAIALDFKGRVVMECASSLP